MKTQSNRLTFSQQFFIATMLFGLFFGAGNLIFPIFLGSQAGRNVWPAIVGLLITGVGIPLLGVAAQGISRSNGLQEMAGRVSPRYSIFFTCALYLTIGPFFAIPRCASTSFTVGIEPLLGENVNATVLLRDFEIDADSQSPNMLWLYSLEKCPFAPCFQGFWAAQAYEKGGIFNGQQRKKPSLRVAVRRSVAGGRCILQAG